MNAGWIDEVMDPEFLRLLDRLVWRRRRPGLQAAGRSIARASRKSGLEWVDSRRYEPGDDLRYLDWHLMARMGRPYVRRFSYEQAERLDLLIDTSGSMALGQPPKFEVACALAMVFGYLALSCGERVGAVCLADRIVSTLPARRGPAQLNRLREFLAHVAPSRPTDLARSLGGFAARSSEIGNAVVISDLLDRRIEPALQVLQKRGFEVGVIRVRSAGDEDVDHRAGVLNVRDIETGRQRYVSLTHEERERYRRARAREAEQTRRLCGNATMPLALLDAWKPLPELVFTDLREAGFFGQGRAE
jgi:uncharacterized protein (DUF58 family)